MLRLGLKRSSLENSKTQVLGGKVQQLGGGWKQVKKKKGKGNTKGGEIFIKIYIHCRPSRWKPAVTSAKIREGFSVLKCKNSKILPNQKGKKMKTNSPCTSFSIKNKHTTGKRWEHWGRHCSALSVPQQPFEKQLYLYP